MAPTPTQTIEDVGASPLSADVGPSGLVAFAMANGEVVLRRIEGEAPALANQDGKGESRVTFTPSGAHVVSLRAGRLVRWALPAACSPRGGASREATPK